MADPFTPEWWLSRLIVELGAKQPRYEMLDRYHRSDPPLPPGPDKGKANTAFDYLRKKSRVNWAEMIVEALIERMKVLGFRTGTEGDEQADTVAWTIWQKNDLDTQSVMLHRAKAVLGDAYVIVGEIDDELGVPLVTCEDPRQMIGAFAPGNRRQLVAALKVFYDDVENVDRAYLYQAGVVHKAFRPRKKGVKTLAWNANGWVWTESEELSNDRMPVVWFPNRADLAGRTMGEFEHVIDDLDRIILLVMQRLTVAVLQAFRQRAVKGNLPDKDEYGNVIDYNVLFSSDPAALWQLPPGVEMWESAGVDLTPILESVKADVRELAGRTRTPLYYLYPDSGGSAEGAVTQREGLIFRASTRITETSGPWETVMALALQTANEDVPAGGDFEALWLPPDRATAAEKYDAASKATAAGVPWRTVMSEVLQFSPQAVERMERERVGTPTADDPSGSSRELSAAETVQKVYLGVGSVLTVEEARAMVNEAGGNLGGLGPTVTE